MKYIYYINNNEETFSAQEEGIKNFLIKRNIYIGDCSLSRVDVSIDDEDYQSVVQDELSVFMENSTLYIWDFALLGRSIDNVYSFLSIALSRNIYIVQCCDGFSISPDTQECRPFLEALSLSARICESLGYTPNKKRKRISSVIINEFPALESDDVFLKKYSDKTFLVCGNTKCYKEILKELGGIFNYKFNDGKPAWCFQNKRLDIVVSALNSAIIEKEA